MHPSAAPRGPISSSAPPQFRVKKKKPGESNPEPQNSGRMTGPPMQMGAGAGSMFADGRKGNPQGMAPRTPNMPMGGPGPMRPHGQPQFSPPPTPNYPKPAMRMPAGQHQGQHPRGVPTATPMMADGKKPEFMSDPPPIGGAPDDQDMAPDTDDQAGGPQEGSPAGEMGMPPVIKPESVNYHDMEQKCSGCQYFGQDGQCAVLQMQVSPDGACNAWEAAGGGDQDMAPVDTGAGFTQNPEGTSGAPELG